MSTSRYFELNADTKSRDLKAVARDQIIYLNPGRGLEKQQRNKIFSLVRNIPKHIHTIQPGPHCNPEYLSRIKPGITNMVVALGVTDNHILEAPGSIEKLYLVEGLSLNTAMAIRDRIDMQHIVYDGLVGIDVLEMMMKNDHIKSHAVYVSENAMILAGYYPYGVKSVEVDEFTTINAVQAMLNNFELDTIFIRDNTLSVVADYLMENHPKCVALMNGISQSDCITIAKDSWKLESKPSQQIEGGLLPSMSIFTDSAFQTEHETDDVDIDIQSDEVEIKPPFKKRARFR